MKFTIITVTYNSATTLPATIDSASTDGTLDIIKQAAAQDKRIRWVSEPDEGIADAFNKGLRTAVGDLNQ
ncbi:MAG: glycosyltransferase [Desulfuromonadales bacterium]|nr:glycosyltransferase [Desulfuromonadales bacterium]